MPQRVNRHPADEVGVVGARAEVLGIGFGIVFLARQTEAVGSRLSFEGFILNT